MFVTHADNFIKEILAIKKIKVDQCRLKGLDNCHTSHSITVNIKEYAKSRGWG